MNYRWFRPAIVAGSVVAVLLGLAPSAHAYDYFPTKAQIKATEAACTFKVPVGRYATDGSVTLSPLVKNRVRNCVKSRPNVAIVLNISQFSGRAERYYQYALENEFAKVGCRPGSSGNTCFTLLYEELARDGVVEVSVTYP